MFKTEVKKEDKTLLISKEILKCFSSGFHREMYCDFTVVVENVKFPCHRFVLSACSGFFEALLRADMKERNENSATIKEISPNIFKSILDVIYNGSDVLTSDNMMEMWRAAHQLQIDFLVKMCEETVMENLTNVNVNEISQQAKLLLSVEVLKFVSKYMAKNFFSLVKFDYIQQLEYDELLNIMSDPDIAACADFKVEAILKWCSASHGINVDRISNLEYLIKLIDLKQLSKDCLFSLMTNDLVLGNKPSITIINKYVAINMTNSTPTTTAGITFSSFNMNYQVQQNCSKCQHCVKTLSYSFKGGFCGKR